MGTLTSDRMCGLCRDAINDMALLRTPHFVVMPGYGQFTAEGGYLLIATASHEYTSSSSFDEKLFAELELVMQEAAGLVKEAYGVNPIFFEHGSTCHAKAGQCVSHMHMHLIPADVDIAQYVSGRDETVLDALSDLVKVPAPYLYVRSSDGSQIASSVGSRTVPSQYLRAAIGKEMGHPEASFWNWRLRRAGDEGWLDDEAIDNTRARLTNMVDTYNPGRNTSKAQDWEVWRESLGLLVLRPIRD